MCRRRVVVFLIPDPCHLIPGSWLGGPGGDLLSRALRRSTIGAEGFHGRVRDGIGCLTPRHGHQVVQARDQRTGIRDQRGPVVRGPAFLVLISSLSNAAQRGMPGARARGSVGFLIPDP